MPRGVKSGLSLILLGHSLGSLFPTAFADQYLRRPYQSPRTAGMGNVRLSTGLYDDNFFNNPARATANPQSRFSVIDWTLLESSISTLKNVQDIQQAVQSHSQNFSPFLDDRLHARSQLLLAGYYQAPTTESRWAFAAVFLTSFQADALSHRHYAIDIDGLLEIGPTLTTGYAFLEDRSLSVGVNTHLSYRVSLDPDYSLEDFINGKSFQLSKASGAGGMVDFDLGTRYRFSKTEHWEWEVAASLQNLLGGTYQQFFFGPQAFSRTPFPQPRSVGFGLSVVRPESWWAFSQTIFGLEVTDIGAHPSGSFYKLLHAGAETSWKSLSFQTGINQGYLCFGLGWTWKLLTLRAVTYGEEMGLNAGNDESRRFLFHFGIHL